MKFIILKGSDMTLDKYNQKRDFNSTTEPKSRHTESNKDLIFVVQKHAASRLHYDFRLEMDGVLKSWAIPKGPSMDPDDKRLAIMVEDHPFDYKDFEGNIPEGNYGAGSVMLWDNGTYSSTENDDGDNHEKHLLEKLNKGYLSISLKGKKLKGEFSLVRMEGKKDNQWLLVKKTDEYSNENDILEMNKSVISSETIESLGKKLPQKEEKSANSSNRKDLKKDFDIKIEKQTLHLTNQNKIYFPDDGITKGDVVEYYRDIAEFILPYLKDRPQSMNRFPNGIKESGFFQKNIDVSKVPSWVKTEKIFSESNNDYIDYLICNDKDTLIYMANLGCIELNPWNSTIQNIEKPDWLVLDLDPDQIDFKEVVKVALVIKDILDKLGIESVCKTSGSRGLHVFIPLAARYDYDTVLIFAQLLAKTVHSQIPETTSLVRAVDQRRHKIYIDYLQNRRGQTLAAPYSVRPRVGATISTPLEWNEVNSTLSPALFTIKTIMKRLEVKGDLWKPILGKGTDIDKVIKNVTVESDIIQL